MQLRIRSYPAYFIIKMRFVLADGKTRLINFLKTRWLPDVRMCFYVTQFAIQTQKKRRIERLREKDKERRKRKRTRWPLHSWSAANRLEGWSRERVVVGGGWRGMCGKRKMKNKCARGNTLHRWACNAFNFPHKFIYRLFLPLFLSLSSVSVSSLRRLPHF